MNPAMHYNFSGGNLERQPAVRHFAVVIFLPPPLEEIVAPLREKFDPDYDSVSAHITMVFPWETTRTIEEITDPLSFEIALWQPLRLDLGPIDDFYPEAPIIYWSVKNAEALNKLYRRLYTCLELPVPFKNLVPHVTVAREISDHRILPVKDHIASYVRDESFQVEAVDLISPVADHNWVSVRTFPVPVT
jgi:2'-5' RNA ligase